MVVANLSNTNGSATVKFVRSVNCCYVSGVPPILLNAFLRLVSGERRCSGITVMVSVHSASGFDKVVTTLSRLRGANCSIGVICLSVGARITLGHCGLAHEGRPCTSEFGNSVTRTLTFRQRTVTPLHSGTSFIVSDSSLANGRLEAQLARVLMNSSGSIVGVRIRSFKFGRNVPSRTSFIVSIHYLPGPC